MIYYKRKYVMMNQYLRLTTIRSLTLGKISEKWRFNLLSLHKSLNRPSIYIYLLRMIFPQVLPLLFATIADNHYNNCTFIVHHSVNDHSCECASHNRLRIFSDDVTISKLTIHPSIALSLQKRPRSPLYHLVWENRTLCDRPNKFWKTLNRCDCYKVDVLIKTENRNVKGAPQ